MRRQPVPQYETDWPVQLSSPPLSNAAATGSASHQRPSSGGSGSSVSSADRYESGYGWPAPVSRSVVLPQTNNNASQDQLRGRENLPNDPEQARGLEEKPVRPEYSERRQTSHVRDTGFRAWIHRAVSSKLQWAYLAVLAVQAGLSRCLSLCVARDMLINFASSRHPGTGRNSLWSHCSARLNLVKRNASYPSVFSYLYFCMTLFLFGVCAMNSS